MSNYEDKERQAVVIWFVAGLVMLVIGIVMFVHAQNELRTTAAWIDEMDQRVVALRETANYMENQCSRWIIEDNMILEHSKIPEVWPDSGNDYSTAQSTTQHAQ